MINSSSPASNKSGVVGDATGGSEQKTETQAAKPIIGDNKKNTVEKENHAAVTFQGRRRSEDTDYHASGKATISVAKLCTNISVLDDALKTMATLRARESSSIMISLRIWPHDIQKKEHALGTDAMSLAFFCPTIGRTELSYVVSATPLVVQNFTVETNVTFNASISVQLFWPGTSNITIAGNGIPASIGSAREFLVRNAVENAFWVMHFTTTPRGLLNGISFTHDSEEHKLLTAKILQDAIDNEFEKLKQLAKISNMNDDDD
jgi:hypothetical protein